MGNKLKRFGGINLGLAAAIIMALGGVGAAIFTAHKAHAIQPVHPPQATYGALQLSATTAKKVPTNGLTDRNVIGVCNLDTATVYCGWNSSVTDSNGWPIFASTCQAFDLSFGGAGAGQQAPGAGGVLYCYSVGGTAANKVRYMELK